MQDCMQQLDHERAWNKIESVYYGRMGYMYFRGNWICEEVINQRKYERIGWKLKKLLLYIGLPVVWAYKAKMNNV